MSTETVTTTNSRAESRKLIFEILKHLTVVNSGGALLVIALVEKLFPNPEWPALIAGALFCFLLSMTTSVAAMIGVVHDVSKGDEGDRDGTANLFATAFCSFLLANYTIVVFALKNFF